MPVCNELEDVTASHRAWLPAFMYLQSINAALEHDAGADEHGIAPSLDTVHAAIDLITDVPVRLLGDPTVDTFFGEIHMSWRRGSKQVVLMFLPNRTPLVHHYLRIPNAASEHGIEEATADNINAWLTWLRE